jgi:hypothetical protein
MPDFPTPPRKRKWTAPAVVGASIGALLAGTAGWCSAANIGNEFWPMVTLISLPFAIVGLVIIWVSYRSRPLE